MKARQGDCVGGSAHDFITHIEYEERRTNKVTLEKESRWNRAGTRRVSKNVKKRVYDVGRVYFCKRCKDVLFVKTKQTTRPRKR